MPLPPPFEYPVKFCVLITATTYVLSIITGNVSQVDRVWTFLPTLYTAYYALATYWPHVPVVGYGLVPYMPKGFGEQYSPRALMMSGLTVIWMLRLSYNTYRRGLFSLTDEDYRWAILRTQIPPWIFQIFNLFFIAITQNVLLFLLGLPAEIAAVQQTGTPLGLSDYILAGTALTLLAIEFTADNQQFAFQSFKHSGVLEASRPAADDAGRRVRLGSGTAEPYDESKQWPGARLRWTVEDARRGFVTRGLWAYSRHPNFVCEQAFWWVITLFPLLSPYPPHLPLQPGLQHPDALTISGLQRGLLELAPLLPAVALSALFFSSTQFTENITAGKYPAYEQYRKRVGMFMPTRTWEKGLLLGWRRGEAGKKEVERAIWGEGKTA